MVTMHGLDAGHLPQFVQVGLFDQQVEAVENEGVTHLDGHRVARPVGNLQLLEFDIQTLATNAVQYGVLLVTPNGTQFLQALIGNRHATLAGLSNRVGDRGLVHFDDDRNRFGACQCWQAQQQGGHNPSGESLGLKHHVSPECIH